MDKKQLYKWCRVSAEELEGHADRRVPFQMVKDSETMGAVMAAELVSGIEAVNAEGRGYRAIVPCGPKCWYAPFTKMVNDRNVSMRNVTIFHMDECLDWEGKPLAKNDPYNFRTFMEEHFYGGIRPELAVPQENRFFPTPDNCAQIAAEIKKAPIDLTLGGWGQDGHIAYNQSRREPFSPLSLDELRNCSVRVQNNNIDTIITLAQRSYGAAYQFVPPMSVTLGLKECLSAKKVRLYSDTGAWKQTALRVALFSEPTPEYPITLLQEHPDAMVVATYETACHPIAEHPEWEFNGITE